jgi:hypothetical protein
MLFIAHLYTVAGTMAARPVLSVILMSIVFEQYKQLSKIVSDRHGD